MFDKQHASSRRRLFFLSLCTALAVVGCKPQPQPQPEKDAWSASKPRTEKKEQKYSGVGVRLGFRDRAVWIEAVVPEGPAAQAGLQQGDRIVRIDDLLSETLSLEEVRHLFRGPEKSRVRVHVMRQGHLLAYTVRRAWIQVPP